METNAATPRSGKLGRVFQRFHRCHRTWRLGEVDAGIHQRRMQRLGQAVRIEHHFRPVIIAGARVDQLAKLRQRDDRGSVCKVALHHRRQPRDVSDQDQAVLAVIEREQQVDRRVREIGSADVHKPVH